MICLPGFQIISCPLCIPGMNSKIPCTSKICAYGFTSLTSVATVFHPGTPGRNAGYVSLHAKGTAGIAHGNQLTATTSLPIPAYSTPLVA